ncbi:hypothetical protein Tco_1541416 [Tanacetum coccineum]
MHNNIMASGDALRKCILKCPYQPTTVTILVVPATENSLEVPELTIVETVSTMSPENKDHYESEKEAIHLILTRIRDEIYSTVDACKTAYEIIVKEVNELHAKRIAKNANLLALVATAQTHQDPYYQTSKSHKSYAPTSKASLPTRSHATTRHKQLKKANASLTQELKECKSTLAETSRTLGESNSIRDSCLVTLQNKQTEFERYKAFNDRIVDYDKLERKLNETLGLLAQKDIDIKEGLKLKAYEISVVQEKHDELVKHSLLTKSHYEGLVKEKTKIITNLNLKSQSIQTIHMLSPKCPTFNGRPTFANPMYLKKAQNKKPCLYEIPHDQSDPANKLVLDGEEILTLEEESRSKLNKDLVKPYDYTKNDSFTFVHKLKKEIHVDLKYVESFENEIDELESDKAEFSNMYDMLFLQRNTYVANDTSGLVPQQQKASDYENSDPVPQLQNVSPSADTTVPSQQKLDLLVGPLTNVSRPQLRSTQMKDKVMPNNSHVKDKKTKVEDYHRISNDYSRYTWILFLRSKDETPEVLKDFLMMIQRNLQALVISVRTDRDTQGQIKVLPPRTTKEILARERERKARTTLLMALPEDHLAKFHKMTDAKEM